MVLRVTPQRIDPSPFGSAQGGSGQALFDESVIVDQVGLSKGSRYKEGTPLAPVAAFGKRSYERRIGGAAGSCVDTNNNAADFYLRDVADPQNLASPPTRCGAGQTSQMIVVSSDRSGEMVGFRVASPPHQNTALHERSSTCRLAQL